MSRQRESKLNDILGISLGIFVISLVAIDYGFQKLKQAVYDVFEVNYLEENILEDGTPDLGYHVKRSK